jgi:uncharacterized caspase-like protein
MRLPVEPLHRRPGVRSAFLIVLICLSCLVARPALAEKRVALVIGMSEYRQVPRLPNPTRDADAMTALFQKAGFDLVESKRDLGIAGLRRALREFAEAAQDADIAVVYYAGHGMEVDGANYLIPVDARLASDFDIEDEAVSLDRVLRALDPVKRLKLVILDACRDNPFASTMKRTLASRSIGRGLAKIEPAMSDTLVAFAAKAGAVAMDGDGLNSPFAAALVKHLTEPGLDLRIAFGRVRDDVLKATNNRQEPFVYGSLGGDNTALVPAVAKPAGSDADGRVDYELAAQVGTRAAWDAFLAKHPVGFLADLARDQTVKIAAAQQSRDEADQAQRQAEALAAQKTAEFKKQLEEQSARQTAEAKKKLSEEAKRELEEARQQIADQAKKELDDAKQQLALSQQQAEAARLQLEQVKADAAADAKRQLEQAQHETSQQPSKVAALTPTEQPAPAPVLDPADIARLLQAHLKRVGCYGGSADGKWDETSQRALELFNTNAQTKFDIKVASLDALDAVRTKADRVCPLACPKGQRVDGDHCVRIACSSGFFLNSSGACEKRAEPAPRPKAALRQEPTHSAPSSAGAGGKCFAFNGKQYCE